MVWRIGHYPPGAAPSRDYAVRAPSLDAARSGSSPPPSTSPCGRSGSTTRENTTHEPH